MGVRRAISRGLMTRCELIWRTAGTNRVCARCLELKDKVIGTTDESVQLPPLHPRCRCTIEYRELNGEDKLGDKLNGAIVTHNHPVGSANEYSFSDSDWYLFRDFNLGVLRGLDEKFIYEFNRNPQDIDAAEIMIDNYSYKHWDNIRKARRAGYGYRRWSR